MRERVQAYFDRRRLHGSLSHTPKLRKLSFRVIELLCTLSHIFVNVRGYVATFRVRCIELQSRNFHESAVASLCPER